jgi:hypothetical protein
VSLEEILSEIKNEESKKRIVDYFDITGDTGHSCVRYPETIETIPEGWCGEWKKNVDNQSEVKGK